MTTVAELVTRALKLAGICGDGSAPSAEDMQNGVDTLNEMLFSWPNEGMDVGHVLSAAADTLYVDDAFLKAIRYALAVEILAEKGFDVPASIAIIATEEKDKVRNALVDIDTLRADCALTGQTRTFNHVTGD